jgi:hypothetical protein
MQERIELRKIMLTLTVQIYRLWNVVLQHPVARDLLFLCYSPYHMQTLIKILKSKFLKF